MKILKVSFQNIHSIAKCDLDFTVEPLASAGLFAITGPTGAGKSTILDAITLALYGRIFRHKDSKEIKGSEEGEGRKKFIFGSIMSKGAALCRTEVEFLGESNIEYRASFSLERARKSPSGNIQDPKWEIALVRGGEILATKSRDVQAVIIEKAGLDFEQFTRSVMLCQGAFKQFLEADKNDRASLLERLTSSEIYSNLSVLAFQKYKEEENKYANLQNQHKGLSLLTEEKLAELKETSNEIKLQIQDIEKEEAKALSGIEWFNKVRAIEERMDQAKKNIAQAKLSETGFEPKKQLLAQHKKAVNFKSELDSKASLEKKLNTLSSEKEALIEQLQVLELDVSAHQDNQLQAKTALEELQQRWLVAEPKLQLAENLESLIDADKTRLANEEASFNQILSNLQQQQKLFEAEQLLLTNSKKTVNDHTQWLIENAIDKGLPVVLAEIESLGIQHQEVETAIGSTEKELKAFDESLATSIEKQANAKNEIELETGILHTIKGSIEVYEQQIKDCIGNTSFAELRTKQQEYPVTIVQLEQGLREENQAISLTATLKEEAQKIGLSKDKLVELQVSVAQLEKNKAQAESTVTDKERLLVQSRLISKYEDDRTKLVADEACYLCGSTEHPYVDYQVQLSVNEDEAALFQAKGTLEEIVKQLNHSNQEHTKLLEQINSKEAFLQREQEILNRLNETVKGIIAQNGSNAFWKGSIKETHSFLQNELVSVQSAIVQLEELELKINTQKQQSTEISERLNTANTSLALAQQQIESTNSNISKALSRLAELKVKLDLIITGLTQKLTPFGVNYSNGVSNILSERSQAFIEKQLVLEQEQIKVQELIANLSGITASITAIETEKTDKQKTLESTKKLIDDNLNKRGEVLDWKFNVADSRSKYKEQIQQAKANSEASNTTLVDAQLNFGNKKTSLNDLVEQIQIENLALTQVTEVLNNAVNNLNFSSIEALALAILTQVQVNEIETEAAAISKLLTESETLFKNSEAELDELVLQDMGEIVIDDLIIEAPKYKETIKQLSENLGKISAQITANENQENSAKQILQEIEKQLAIKQRWSQLNELIGSADGKKFKAIAQEFTLEYLVALANNYLQNISDRYMLIPKPDLQLSIADAYQSGSERSVSTLSGGESFLVSLSLALGLSDMAGNRTHIGSLFIDEGFGTLDPETLDVAISALENLQHSRNKSIGIISHVEALKERITTQIEVIKGKSGRSYIKPFEVSVMA